MIQDTPTAQLSPRERQVLHLAAEGHIDAALAKQLGISEATVETYWNRMRLKLGKLSRTEMVAVVLKAEQTAELNRLRKQNEALVNRLRAEIEAGDPLYRELLENAPDALLIVDQDGRITLANRVCEELFGYSEGELEGQDLAVLTPPKLRYRHRIHRDQYFSSPTRREMGEHLQTPAVRKDGGEFLIRASLSAIKGPNGPVVTCVIRKVK